MIERVERYAVDFFRLLEPKCLMMFVIYAIDISIERLEIDKKNQKKFIYAKKKTCLNY